MGIHLKTHNETTYQKVQEMFQTGNTAAVIHPTGTGKTFVALKWVEETQGKVLYVSPNKYILNQVKEDIEKAWKAGEITEKQYERYQQIRFMTYTELMEQSKLEENYDQIILDEFHRCGAPEWGKGVKRLLDGSKNAKILGLTATPIRARDNRDMADELFRNRIASEMTLEKAGMKWDEKAGTLSLSDKVDFLVSLGNIGAINQDMVLPDGTRAGQMKWQVRKA